MNATHAAPAPSKFPRKWPRIDGRWSATVQIHGFQATRVECVNVSRGGAAIRGGASTLPEGTVAYFSLELPSGETVQALAKVVHREETNDMAGVQFLTISAGSAGMLASYLGQKLTEKEFPQKSPSRRQRSITRKAWDRLFAPKLPLMLPTADW